MRLFVALLALSPSAALACGMRYYEPPREVVAEVKPTTVVVTPTTAAAQLTRLMGAVDAARLGVDPVPATPSAPPVTTEAPPAIIAEASPQPGV